MKQIFLLFLILFSTLSVADTGTVRMTDASFLATVGGQSFDLYGEMPSGEGTSESSPGKVYIPMANTLTSSRDYFYKNYGGATYNIFGYNSGISASAAFTLTLRSNTSISNGHLYAAVRQNSTGYIIINKFDMTSETNSTTALKTLTSISPQDICAASTAATVTCSNFDQSTPQSQTAGEKDIVVYFFYTSTLYSVNTTFSDITDANHTGGVFILFKMNNTIYDSSFITISNLNPRVGDSRILGSVTANTTLDTSIYRQTVAYYGDTGGCNGIIGQCMHYDGYFVLGNSQTMDYILSGLTNDTDYFFSIGYQDKFGFVTALSQEVDKTPLKIDELLKKQTCFLLTAGFGEEHYIIDYFRHFRSEVLSKYWLGQKFISFYYRYAPKYALSIYNSEAIRFVIRASAYVLYYIFNNLWWILIGFMLILLIVFYKKYFSRKEN